MPAERLGRRLVEAGLCLFAASLPISIAGANIGWAVAAAGLLWSAYEGDAADWKAWRGGLALPLAVFLAAAAAAALFAPAPYHTLENLQKDAHKLWLYALLTTAFTVAPPRRPLLAFAAGSAVAAAYGAVQWFGGLAIPGLVPRAHGWLHAVTFGEQLAVAFCGAVCYLAPAANRSRAAWGAAALFGAALVMSNTRGALAAAAAGVFAVGLFVPRLRRAAAATGVLAVIAMLAADLLAPQRSFILTLLGQGHAVSAQSQGQLGRIYLWKAAWAIGWDHPLFGAGLGGFRLALPSYVPPGTVFDGGEMTVGNAHNLYLNHFAERGLVGLAALGWLLWTAATSAALRAREHGDPLSLWSLAAVTAFLVMNVTEAALNVELVWMLALFVWTAAATRKPSP